MLWEAQVAWKNTVILFFFWNLADWCCCPWTYDYAEPDKIVFSLVCYCFSYFVFVCQLQALRFCIYVHNWQHFPLLFPVCFLMLTLTKKKITCSNRSMKKVLLWCLKNMPTTPPATCGQKALSYRKHMDRYSTSDVIKRTGNSLPVGTD